MAALAIAVPAEPREPDARQVRTLVTAHRFAGDEPRADPDQPSLRYGLYGGRWKAMTGAAVVLVGVESEQLRIGLSLDAFLELANFSTTQPVPWESYRANVGAQLLAQSPRLSRALLPAGGDIGLAIGWFHESDHVANVDAYTAAYRRVYFVPGTSSAASFTSFDNGDFSSYEYIKVRAVWRQPLWGGRITALSAVGTRLFPRPIDPFSIRAMQASVLTEARLSVRVGDASRPFVSGYFELVRHDFVAQAHGFRFGLDREPLRYAIVNAGVDLVSRSGGIISPFLSWSNSHGRGVDFPRFFEHEVGVGITLMP